MRRNLHFFFAALLMAFTAPVFAQVSESFEPAPNQTESVKSQLIQQYWQFGNFDINPSGATPIDGSQSMGAALSFKNGDLSYMATPFLKFTGSEALQFKYNLSRTLDAGNTRCILVYLADMNGRAYLLDSFGITSQTNTVTYNKVIVDNAGTYAIYIVAKGQGGFSSVMIDDFAFTGSYANINQPAHATEIAGTVAGINDIAANNGNITLYPNPAKSLVNLNITNTNSNNATINVYNVDGQRVISEVALLNNGDNTVTVDVSALVAGNYFVNVKTENQVYTQRFVRVQ